MFIILFQYKFLFLLQNYDVMITELILMLSTTLKKESINDLEIIFKVTLKRF